MEQAAARCRCRLSTLGNGYSWAFWGEIEEQGDLKLKNPNHNQLCHSETQGSLLPIRIPSGTVQLTISGTCVFFCPCITSQTDHKWRPVCLERVWPTVVCVRDRNKHARESSTLLECAVKESGYMFVWTSSDVPFSHHLILITSPLSLYSTDLFEDESRKELDWPARKERCIPNLTEIMYAVSWCPLFPESYSYGRGFATASYALTVLIFMLFYIQGARGHRPTALSFHYHCEARFALPRVSCPAPSLPKLQVSTICFPLSQA